MPLITPEEIAALKANAATAALGEKLEKEIFVPKERIDDLNSKLRAAEDQLAKFNAEESKKAEELKKAADAKAIEDGKSKELLAQKELELTQAKKEREELEKKATAYEAQQKKIRDGAIEKIKDPDLKKIAEKLPDVQDVVDFVDKLEKTKPGVYTGKSAGAGGNGKPVFKDRQEAESYYREQGLAQ